MGSLPKPKPLRVALSGLSVARGTAPHDDEERHERCARFEKGETDRHQPGCRARWLRVPDDPLRAKPTWARPATYTKTMFRSDTHDDRAEAREEAFDVLDDLFNTAYTPPKTSVVGDGREMSEWYCDFESDGTRYRLSIDLWDGNFRLFNMGKDGNPAIIRIE